MSFVVNALQSYTNIVQQYDGQKSMQDNNQSRVDAIKNLDMNVISQAGPSDATVQSLSQADKKMVLENANSGMKQTFLAAWQDSLDKQTKKDIAEEFSLSL
ncbi:MAG: hypothetical protein WCF95_05935 [bacterium]